MTSSASPPRFALPAMLGVLGVSILVFLVALTRFISNRAESPATSALTSTATLTPTISQGSAADATPATTPRPSWTPPPSPTITSTRTITPTPTRTLIASITPANPQTLNTRYRLAEWDLVAANRMIELVSERAEFFQAQEWYYAVVYSLQEALLRFPQSVNATTWRWQMAHYQILAGESRALDTYASLIQSALQSGQARISDLSVWFHRNQPDMHLTTTSLPARPGELNRLLIQISGAGNGFIWLVGTPGNVEAVPLLNRFDATTNPQAAALIGDLSGDGQAEMIIYETTHPGMTEAPVPWIFDLRQEPPQLMPMQVGLPLELGTESERQVTLTPDTQVQNTLQLVARMFPTCPVEYTQTFLWDGEKFVISDTQVQVFPETTLLGWCEVVVDHATLQWAPELTLAVAEPLLTSWPPAEDIEGDPYPEDALDAWRFRLGVLQALAGHQVEAVEMFQTIVNTPTSAQSSWIVPAQAFLTTYQSPGDLYRACQAAPGCNLQHAIQTMVRLSGSSSPANARQYLIDHGVVVRTAGYFDFDGDGNDEGWLTIRPTAEGKLEFWILAARTSGVQAIFVQVFESNAPQPYYHDPEEMPPVVQLERGKGFITERDPANGEAAIRFVDVEYSRPTFIRDELNSASQALFYGVDIEWVLNKLLEAEASPRFAGDCVAYGICARFFYTLGLAYELSGNEFKAIDWYLTTWWEYPFSPYTMMARLKLELIPATPTMTPTITRTPTITYTPDPQRTSTPTIMAYPPLFTPTPYP